MCYEQSRARETRQHFVKPVSFFHASTAHFSNEQRLHLELLLLERELVHRGSFGAVILFSAAIQYELVLIRALQFGFLRRDGCFQIHVESIKLSGKDLTAHVRYTRQVPFLFTSCRSSRMQGNC